MKAQEKHEGRAARTSGGGERMEPSRVSIQRDQRYRISPGYVLREIAGEYAIVPVAAGSDSPLENTIMSPNETAVFIWKCFEQTSTVGDVVAKAAQVYDASEAVIASAVERFVAESLTYRIMEEVRSNDSDVG